jgi:hypothetical protein
MLQSDNFITALKKSCYFYWKIESEALVDYSRELHIIWDSIENKRRGKEKSKKRIKRSLYFRCSDGNSTGINM